PNAEGSPNDLITKSGSDFVIRSSLDIGHSSFLETFLTASTNIGSLLCDGIGDAILVQGEEAPGQALRLSYNILQAAGARIFKTDYVACPSCGRTLFNLQTTTAKIKAATSHLKSVKIAIMGCIVNGPGEVADADFGYVGGAPGKVNLYVGKSAVKFNIPEAEAVDRLEDLIREHGKWVDPAARGRRPRVASIVPKGRSTRKRSETRRSLLVHWEPPAPRLVTQRRRSAQGYKNVTLKRLDSIFAAVKLRFP